MTEPSPEKIYRFRLDPGPTAADRVAAISAAAEHVRQVVEAVEPEPVPTSAKPDHLQVLAAARAEIERTPAA